MTLRLKLLLLFTFAIAAAAGITAWNAERYAARQFQQADQQRSDALVAQFRRELSEREAEVTTSVQTIADAESTVRMVLDLSRPQADPSVYAGDARGLAASHQLDFLDLASQDGTLISSAEWPDRVGYKNDWVTRQTDWNQRGAFLDRVELPDRVDLGLVAVRVVHAGNLSVYIIGGQRLNSSFLQTLSLPAGMRALFYRNLEPDFVPAALSDAEGPVGGAEAFAPLIDSLEKEPRGSDETVAWSPNTDSNERFITLPLTGRQGEFLGALLLGSAQQQRLTLENYIGSSALMAVAAGLLLALLLSWWVSARVSRPLARLSEGLGEVTAGDWETQVEPGAIREVKQTIGAFNKMTKQLADERAGQVARERAAAWRQLAGQLAAELKMLLPPLQEAVKSMARPPTGAHDDGGFGDDDVPEAPEQSSVVSSAVQQTLETLAACAGKLGEFASLPVPRLESVNLNDAVRAAVQSFEPRFSAIGRPPINPELFLDERAGQVRADAVLLKKALENLLLFLIEDMPAGGTLSIHTRRQEGMAHMILSGSGSGIPVQRGDGRPRTADRAAQVSGIGLSLATVQSIVSSHGGRISIESAPLAGTTFYLDWPLVASVGGAAHSPVPSFPAVLQNRPEPELQIQQKPARKIAPNPSLQSGPKDDQPLAVPPPQAQEKQEQPDPVVRAAVSEECKELCEESTEKALLEPESHMRDGYPLEGYAPEGYTKDQPQVQKELLEAAPEPQPQSQQESEPQPGSESLVLQNRDSPSTGSAGVEAAPEVVGSEMKDPEPSAQPQPEPKAQPEFVGAQEEETAELAAIIEEVIESRTRIVTTTELFESFNEMEEDEEDGPVELPPAVAAPLETSHIGSADAKAETMVSVASPDPQIDSPRATPSDSPGQLFGVAVPASRSEAEAPERSTGDTSPRLFGIAAPGLALQAAYESLAKAEPPAEKMEETAGENHSKNPTEVVAQPTSDDFAKPSPQSGEHDHKGEGRDSARHQTYSPLTYRW